MTEFHVFEWDKVNSQWTLVGKYKSLKGACKKRDLLMRNGVAVSIHQIIREAGK